MKGGEESKQNNLLLDSRSDIQMKLQENEKTLSLYKETLAREKAVSEMGNYNRIVTGKQLQKDFNEGANPTFKYSELLRTNLQNSLLSKDTRQLPSHFKVVLESFKTLDQSIKTLKLKKSQCFFSDLKIMVERSILREFTLERFQQICFVAPEFFIHKWRKNQDHKVDLLIEIPNNFETEIWEKIAANDQEGRKKVEITHLSWNPLRSLLPNQILRDRMKIFKLRLMEETQKAHDEFLKDCMNSRNEKLARKASDFI